MLESMSFGKAFNFQNSRKPKGDDKLKQIILKKYQKKSSATNSQRDSEFDNQSALEDGSNSQKKFN